MKKKSKIKTKYKFRRVLAVFLLVGVMLGLFLWKSRNTIQVVTVVSTIDNYQYELDSNATRIYKKYFNLLEEELKNNTVDEEKYASLVAELFVIDYYTLNNKITNKNIGGVQYIHSNLKDNFITKASNTIYKYVKSNLYGNRKQKLPEVNNVEVEKIENIKYSNGDYKDSSAYKVIVSVGYVKDYDYPNSVEITLIHEDNKLVIVEIN